MSQNCQTSSLYTRYTTNNLADANDYFVFGENGLSVIVDDGGTETAHNYGDAEYVRVQKTDKVTLTPPSGGALTVYDRYGNSKTYDIDEVVTIDGRVHGYAVKVGTAFGDVEITVVEQAGSKRALPSV